MNEYFISSKNREYGFIKSVLGAGYLICIWICTVTVFFVSGGAGFVGGWTVGGLVEEFSCVAVLDNLYSGCLGNLRDCLDHIVFVEGDVRDRGLVLSVMKKYNVGAFVYIENIFTVFVKVFKGDKSAYIVGNRVCLGI